MSVRTPARGVFVNVPFDSRYLPIERAVLFALLRCDYHPRSARERADSSESRIDKICRIIAECRYAIHDLSRIELDEASGLPRFNMPFEFGVFYGAKRFGKGVHRNKACLVFAKRPHDYKVYLSDISGQDIESHDNDPSRAARGVRDWLQSLDALHRLPSGQSVAEDYALFRRELPRACKKLKFKTSQLAYHDYLAFADDWIQQGTAR